MIWFDIKKLEALLLEGKVSDKLVFNYLFIYLIISMLASYVGEEEDSNWLLWLQLIINLGVLIWGVRKTFQINEEGDNRDYFKRFISLAFVAGVRMLVYMFLFLLPVTLFRLLAESFEITYVNDLWWEVFELAANLGFVFYYYNMLLRSFKRINNSGQGLLIH